MAIEDYCRDTPAEPVVTDNDSASGQPPPTDGETGPPIFQDFEEADNIPPAQPLTVPRGTAPFPAPVIPVAGNPSQISQPAREFQPRFLTANREITIIPDNLFITNKMQTTSMSIFARPVMVEASNEAVINTMRHVTGYTPWFIPELNRQFQSGASSGYGLNAHPDHFRWALGAVWASDSNSEYFLHAPCGPKEQINLVPTAKNNQSYERSSTHVQNILRSKILSLYPGGLATPGYQYSISVQASNTGVGGLQTSERISFGISHAEHGFLSDYKEGPVHNALSKYTEPIDILMEELEEFVGSLPPLGGNPTPFNPEGDPIPQRPPMEGERSPFDGLPLDRRPAFEMSTRQKYKLYLNCWLFGDTLANRSNWEVLEDAFAIRNRETEMAMLDYLRPGLISGETHHDYVFDAPVAFYEEEMNNLVMSPSHSAKITGHFGSMDLTNQRRYQERIGVTDMTPEMQVPNLYRLYSYLEMEKDYGNPNANLNPQEQVAWNMTSKMLKEWRNPEFNVLDMTYDQVLKFPSDRVEKFNEINEFMREYAPNIVEIKIRTSQGGQINSFLQRNKMDRLLLETLNPFSTRYRGDRVAQATEFGKKQNALNTMVLDDSYKTRNLSQSPPLEPAVAPQGSPPASFDPFLAPPGGISVNSAGMPIAPTSNNVPNNTSNNAMPDPINERTESGLVQTLETGFFDLLKFRLPESNNSMLQYTKLDQYPLLYTGWNNVDLLRFEEAIKSQIFISETEKHILESNLFRTYADILNGARAHSEVVGYRIDKHLITEDDSGQETVQRKPMQSIYLMDSNNIDDISYFDSQVLPFRKYKYKIYTINMVLGTEYRHNVAKSNVPAFNTIQLVVDSKPKMYFIEAPFFEQEIEVKDMPPLPPQVSFLPKQGVDNNFGILLTTNYGEVTEQRINFILGPMVDPRFTDGRPLMTTFRTDSLPTHFEATRLEKAPEKWKDFSLTGPQVEKFKTKSYTLTANSNSAFLNQDVEPNKYYYYTFRSIDNFDNKQWDASRTMISNPSEVYRVRMVSYENGIFMEMEPYEMYEKPKKFKMEFTRLLKICPSYDQTLFNFQKRFNKLAAGNDEHIPNNAIKMLRDELNLNKFNYHIAEKNIFQKSMPELSDVSLGIKKDDADLIWSRRFKFRIRSKNTGKVLDLNVNFKRNKKHLELFEN